MKLRVFAGHTAVFASFGVFFCAAQLPGCTASSADPGATPQAITAEVTERVTNVAHVRWSTAAPTVGYVAYGTTPELEFNTPMESELGIVHDVRLLGLAASTEFFYRVVTWTGDDAGASAVSSFMTGGLPVSVPQLQLEGGGLESFVLVPVGNAVVVVDPAGRVVWYHLDEGGRIPYRARMATDHSNVLYSVAALTEPLTVPGSLLAVSFDGVVAREISVPGLAGDFVELPDGTLAAAVTEYRDVNGTSTRGDSIVEIDATGNQSIVWSSWDCFDPATVPGNGTASEWASVNALQYDAASDAYFVGFPSFGSIVQVNRAARTCGWVMGQSGATLAFAAGITPLTAPRQFEVQSGRLMLVGTDTSLMLRAVEYQIDPTAGLVTELWSHTGPASSGSASGMAEPTRLSSNAVFINWASEGIMEVVDSQGVPSWTLRAPADEHLGLHDLVEDLYATP